MCIAVLRCHENMYRACSSIRDICLKIVKLVEQHFLSVFQLSTQFTILLLGGERNGNSKSFSFRFAVSHSLLLWKVCVGGSVTRVLTYQVYSWRWHLIVRTIECNESFVCDRNRCSCRWCCALFYRRMLMAAMECVRIKNGENKMTAWRWEEECEATQNENIILSRAKCLQCGRWETVKNVHGDENAYKLKCEMCIRLWWRGPRETLKWSASCGETTTSAIKIRRQNGPKGTMCSAIVRKDKSTKSKRNAVANDNVGEHRTKTSLTTNFASIYFDLSHSSGRA